MNACDCMVEDPGDGYGERVVTHSGTCPLHPEHDTIELDALLARYDTWVAERTRLSEQEGEGAFPPADEWHWSDDEGCELADLLAHAIRSRLR